MQTQNRYYAHKLKIKEIPWQTAKHFTTKYHRDGMPTKSGGNKIAYGLYNDDELLAVAMFCNPHTATRLREYTSELLRLTFKPNTHIVGGTSKLIKQYITDKNPWDLFTYENISSENTDAGMQERVIKNSSMNRLFEWRNPNISFYIYKITSTASNGYYIGRHVKHMSEDELKQQHKQNPKIDTYMGSGGIKFQNWVKKVGEHTLKKEILKIVATHKQASYQEKKIY